MAGHMDTKNLRYCVIFNSKGSQSNHVLDDRIGGYQYLSLAIRSCEFGFLFKDEKCNWKLSLKVIWSGHLLGRQNNKLFITEERIKQLQILCFISVKIK